MFGGKLCNKGIAINSDINTVLLAFSNSLYLFSLKEGTLINKFTIHEQPILTFLQHQNQFISIDASGNICKFKLQTKGIKIITKIKIKGNHQIKEAVIQHQNIYYIDIENQLYCFNINDKKSTYLGVYSHIFGIWNNLIVLLTKQTAKDLIIFNVQARNVSLRYTHYEQITSALIRGQNLIIGDINGKITIIEDGTLGNLNNKRVLEWHLHSVLALQNSGNYLVSGGEQSTVVMWHLKQHTRDFLPRVGTPISKIVIQNSKVICFMSDNSVKLIDLNQDKKTVIFRLIYDPQSYITVKNSLRKFENIPVNNKAQTICMNSLPGKLQMIVLRSGKLNEIQVISRNYVSRLDENYPNPHQIKSFALNKEWNKMIVAVEGKNHSSLKFYELENQEWKISGKVQRPHIGQTEQCLHLSDIFQDKFVSFCLTDPRIKIWRMYRQKKKSILEIDQSFWNCEFQVDYRGRLPLWITCAINLLIVTYQNQMVIFDLKQRKIRSKFTIPNIKKCTFISLNKICIQLKDKIIIMNLKIDNQIPEHQFSLDLNDNNNIRVITNIEEQKLAIHLSNEEQDKIILYDCNLKSATNVYDLNENIQGCFWLKNKFIVISNSLLFYDLTHNQQLFRNHQKMIEEPIQINDEQQNSKDTQINFEILSSKWISNKDILHKNMRQEIMSNAYMHPSLATTFSTLVYQTLL